MAALVVDANSSNITIKDFNIVNSVPVMVTQGEKDACITPNKDSSGDVSLPNRANLVVCDESTSATTSDEITAALALSNSSERIAACNALTDLTAENSAYLVRSSAYNERGHAIAILGDMITLDGVRARGNQDSIYISSGRIYFHGCDLIGGTDYIYGDATAVFDSCKLGAEGMTDKSYPTTITATNTAASNPYGYLFWNCTVYNVLDNITGGNVFGRPWRQDAQVTFYNTKLDDTKEIGASAASISDKGWSDMSDNTKEAARFYEYGTYNASGTAVDLSGRVVRDDGFGSVLDKWQILEFNPRNYFNSSYHMDKGRSEWDPMNFGETYLSEVDAQIAAATITVPEGEDTTITLPTPTDSNIEFMWESASTNAVVSDDGTSIEVIRPAAGEEPIESTVTLYVMDKTTGYGDKVEIPVTIAATTDTTNVFNIPVTITQSTSDDNTYIVTITKDGATIKTQEIKVSALETTATIENIPASADGIEYDVTIVSESDDFSVTSPTDGKTTVTGITGTDVSLSITAQKLVDDEISLNISAAASDDTKTYDLIRLAIDAGADESSIKSSDSIVVEYDIEMGTTHSYDGYVDILSETPSSSCTTSALSTRYTLTKINQSWDQLDAVDCSQWFSGASNGDGQCLNLTGKFNYTGSESAHVTDTIDYKNGTVSVYGSNLSSAYTFASFPSNCSRGSVYMGFYPGSTSDDYTLSNVTVTYKKLVTDEDTSATATPTVVTSTWYFGESNGAASYAIEGNNQTVEIEASESTASEKPTLTVDVSSGKFNNSGRNDKWAQVNDGTKFIIPVTTGSTITYEAYGTSGTLTDEEGNSFKSGETYTYTGTETTVTLTASGVSYMSYLTLVSYEYDEDTSATATPEPTATTEPDRTITWTANNSVTDDYTVTEEEGVYTFDVTAEKSVDGALWSADLSAWLDGYSYGDMDTLTFSFDFMIESEDNRPSADGYIDLSTGTSYSYSDTDNARISRYNIYNGWDQFNYYGATSTRTNGGLKFNDYLGKWYTLVTTVDLINKTVSTTTTVDGKSATYNIATADFATALVDNKLYLNVMPTRSNSDLNEVKFSIANIDVGYTLIFGDSETDSGLYYKDGDTSTLYGVIRFLQALEKATEVESYGFVFCDSDGTILDKNTNSIVSTESGEIEGFYGDIYDISADNYNETGATAYAKAFVVINGVYYYSPAFSGTVDSSTGIVTYSEPE